MADLKLDLLDKLRKDKYYEEIELVRLAQDPNMNYKEKIILMGGKLQKLAILNAQMGLVEQYFQTPQSPPLGTSPSPVGTQNTHQGQSHGE